LNNPHILENIRDTNQRISEKRFDVRNFTGYAAAAVAILTLGEFIVKVTHGTRPALTSGYALTTYMHQTANPELVVVLIDTVLMAALIVFLASFREVIVRARKDLRWVTDIAFGAGLVFVAITLVGDSMDAGAALDAVNGSGSATIIRALIEGHMLMFGPIGCALIAVIAAAFAYATFASKVIPTWTSWIAYIVSGLNILAFPAIFGGTDPHSIFSSTGNAVTILATFPFLVWVVAVGIVTIKNKKYRNRIILSI
jgi:hypothetical protein